MDKKGLRGFIRNRLPKTWEIVLTRERKLTAFIEYVYEATPSVMKGGRGWRREMCIRDSDRAVQRGFDRAESFFKNPKFYDDYHKFVLFNVSKEELEKDVYKRQVLAIASNS